MVGNHRKIFRIKGSLGQIGQLAVTFCNIFETMRCRQTLRRETSLLTGDSETPLSLWLPLESSGLL